MGGTDEVIQSRGPVKGWSDGDKDKDQDKTKRRSDYRPTDDEPFMNKKQREYFRKKLQAWRDDIVRESRETLTHLQSATATFPISLTVPRRKPNVVWNSERVTGSAS